MAVSSCGCHTNVPEGVTAFVYGIVGMRAPPIKPSGGTGVPCINNPLAANASGEISVAEWLQVSVSAVSNRIVTIVHHYPLVNRRCTIRVVQKTLEEQIVRAKELLATVRHAAMATVNEDGSPHNSPFMFMRDDSLEHVYWCSHPDSMHSRNVLRTGQLFVVLYVAVERGGLFMQCDGGHILEGPELDEALAVHNGLRKERGQDQLPRSYYVGDSPQRMWSASVTRLWVNGTLRGDDGLIIRDVRTEISTADLL